MNLELIIKLIRLANNNPNDNEANVAARRACKMLAEDDCKFLLGKSIPITNPAHSGFTSQWYKESYDKYANYRQTNPINRCIKCGNETQILVKGYCVNCILEKQSQGDYNTKTCTKCGKPLEYRIPLQYAGERLDWCKDCNNSVKQTWPKVCYYCTKLIEKHQQHVNQMNDRYYHYNCYGKEAK